MDITREQYHASAERLEAKRYALRTQLLDEDLDRDQRVNLLFKISHLAAIIGMQEFIHGYLTDEELAAVLHRNPDERHVYVDGSEEDAAELDKALAALDSVSEGNTLTAEAKATDGQDS